METRQDKALFEASYKRFLEVDVKNKEVHADFMRCWTDVLSLESGFNKEELSGFMGYSKSYISQIPSHIRSGVDNDTLAKKINRINNFLLNPDDIQLAYRKAFANLRNLELPAEFDRKIRFLVDFSKIDKRKNGRNTSIQEKVINKKMQNNSAPFTISTKDNKSVDVEMPDSVAKLILQISNVLDLNLTVGRKNKIVFKFE